MTSKPTIKPDQYDNGNPCWTVSWPDCSGREANFSHYADAVLFASVAAPEVEPDVVVGGRWNGMLACPNCAADIPAGEPGAVQCPSCCAMLDVSRYMHTAEPS